MHLLITTNNPKTPATVLWKSANKSRKYVHGWNKVMISKAWLIFPLQVLPNYCMSFTRKLRIQ